MFGIRIADKLSQVSASVDLFDFFSRALIRLRQLTLSQMWRTEAEFNRRVCQRMSARTIRVRWTLRNALSEPGATCSAVQYRCDGPPTLSKALRSPTRTLQTLPEHHRYSVRFFGEANSQVCASCSLKLACLFAFCSFLSLRLSRFPTQPATITGNQNGFPIDDLPARLPS